MSARGVTVFLADLTVFETGLGQDLDAFVQALMFVLAENVVVGGPYGPGTPVDTGYARASWWLSLNAPTEGPVVTVGQAQLATDASLALQAKAGDTIYLINNAQYIQALEDGHSGQAPNGMVGVVLMQGQRIVDDLARQRLGNLGRVQ